MTPAPKTDNVPRSSPNCTTDDHRVSSRTNATMNPFDVADRLKTFNNKWPVPFIRAKEMADAGFLYTNSRDIVECPFCKIRVGQWAESDIPFSEHEKHSPNCQFVLDSKQLFHPTSSPRSPPTSSAVVQNDEQSSSPRSPPTSSAVVQNDEQSSSPQSPPTSSGEDTCGLNGIECSRNDPVLELQHMSKDLIMQKLNVNATARPIANKYVNLTDRLRTYENWQSMGPKLKPENLSEAGFVYTGETDRVYCFHCGGSLLGWHSSDDPWVEHAHWFPNCKYVRFVKGQQFVDCARLKKKEDLSKTEEEIRNAIELFKELVSISDFDRIHAIDADQSSSNENTSSSSSSSCSESEKLEQSSCSNSLSPVTDRDSQMTCLCCLENERDTVLIPCYHIVACMKCAQKLNKCCFCREPVIYHRRVFIP